MHQLETWFLGHLEICLFFLLDFQQHESLVERLLPLLLLGLPLFLMLLLEASLNASAEELTSWASRVSPFLPSLLSAARALG